MNPTSTAGLTREKRPHSGLGLHTAADVHYGTVEQTREKRAGVLEGLRRPPRAVRPQATETAEAPTASWINRPDDTEEAAQ